jgi:hypothetical protein
MGGKMNKILLALVLVIGMNSVASAEEARVEANLTAFEFNALSSAYMTRPTFANIVKRGSGSPFVLEFTVDGYGKGRTAFGVANEFVDENIEVINKFLNWAEMATERGDMLDKEIAVVRGVDTGPFYVWNRYKFHSGNSKAHFLVIDIGTKVFGGFSKNDQMSAGSVVFDEENAGRLIKRLLEFKDKKISTTNTEDYK